MTMKYGPGPETAQCQAKNHAGCGGNGCSCYCHIQEAARVTGLPIKSDACKDSRHFHCKIPDCECSCHGTLQLEQELNPPPQISDVVNHPAHYNSHPSGIEVIEITRWMNYNRGNAVKYILRAGLKPETDEILDLEKARWYLSDEIARLLQIRDASSTPTPEIDV